MSPLANSDQWLVELPMASRPTQVRAVDQDNGIELAVLVTGSRNWRFDSAAKMSLDRLRQCAPPRSANLLVHGGADGADTVVSEHAYRSGWRVKMMRPQYDKYAKRVAPLRRNDAMVDQVTEFAKRGATVACLALWRDHSRGTRYTIDRFRSVVGIEPFIVYDCACHCVFSACPLHTTASGWQCEAWNCNSQGAMWECENGATWWSH